MTSDEDRRKRFEAVADEVYEPLQRYLRRRIARVDAEDLLADVLMTVWRRLDDAPRDRVLPWCYGIARNTLANHRRSQTRHLRLVSRLESEPRQRHVPDPAETGPDSELSAALSSLSEEDQEILRLWAWEQLEPREIGPALGVSVNAATLRLSRARARLAEALAGQDRPAAGHEVG